MRKFKDAFLNNLSRVQNVVIAILCFTVLLQISHLWFVNLSNGQSLYTNDNKSVAEVGLKKEFLSPMRILKSIDYNTFYCIYEGDGFINAFNTYDKVLLEANNKADYMGQEDLTQDFLDKSNLLIFDYSYKIDSEMLIEALNSSKNAFNKIDEFDKVAINIEENMINIYFIDTTENIYYYYTLYNNMLYNSVLEVSNDVVSEMTYSYNIDRSQMVYDDELIANIDEGVAYKNIDIENPYATIYGDSPRNLVESKVDKYFKNISYMKFSPSETAYIFSDTDTVVKYFNSGILEYSYYDVYSTSYEYSIVEDFAIAKSFLNNETDIVNNYYLSNYYRNDFETIFEFSYVVNNLPIYYENEDGYSQVPIKITVKNNVVTNCSRIVYNFVLSDNSEKITKSFYDAISIFSPIDDEETIENINLGYKVKSPDDEMTLYWFMKAFESDTSLSTH